MLPRRPDITRVRKRTPRTLAAKPPNPPPKPRGGRSTYEAGLAVGRRPARMGVAPTAQRVSVKARAWPSAKNPRRWKCPATTPSRRALPSSRPLVWAWQSMTNPPTAGCGSRTPLLTIPSAGPNGSEDVSEGIGSGGYGRCSLAARSSRCPPAATHPTRPLDGPTPGDPARPLGSRKGRSESGHLRRAESHGRRRRRWTARRAMLEPLPHAPRARKQRTVAPRYRG